MAGLGAGVNAPRPLVSGGARCPAGWPPCGEQSSARGARDAQPRARQHGLAGEVSPRRAVVARGFRPPRRRRQGLLRRRRGLPSRRACLRLAARRARSRDADRRTRRRQDLGAAPPVRALPRPQHRVLYLCDTAVRPLTLYRMLAVKVGLRPTRSSTGSGSSCCRQSSGDTRALPAAEVTTHALDGRVAARKARSLAATPCWSSSRRVRTLPGTP